MPFQKGQPAKSRGPRKEDRGPQVKMTARQHLFVEALIRGGDPTAAAVEAGYKESSAKMMATILLTPEKYPLVCAKVEELRAVRNQSAVLDSQGVLKYINTAMTFNPFRYFKPGGDGGWLIAELDFAKLPDEIGQLVEECEVRTVETGTSKVVMMWVRLISKTAMTALAAKYQLSAGTTPAQVGPVGPDGKPLPPVDWDALMGRAGFDPANDPVERRLLALEAGSPPSTKDGAPKPPFRKSTGPVDAEVVD